MTYNKTDKILHALDEIYPAYLSTWQLAKLVNLTSRDITNRLKNIEGTEKTKDGFQTLWRYKKVWTP